MILRLSQKLNTKIKAGRLAALPLDENPLADWSAHLFVSDRTQYILLSNTKSLYSTVLYGKGITDDGVLIDRALTCLREFMASDGLEAVFRQFIVAACESVRFAKALNRSVIGSMNDLVNHATAWLAEGDVSPHDVGIRLNDILLSALAPSKSDGYGRPRDSFLALVGSAGR
jgi:Domain of unknown function (DUF6933)